MYVMLLRLPLPLVRYLVDHRVLPEHGIRTILATHDERYEKTIFYECWRNWL